MLNNGGGLPRPPWPPFIPPIGPLSPLSGLLRPMADLRCAGSWPRPPLCPGRGPGQRPIVAPCRAAGHRSAPRHRVFSLGKAAAGSVPHCDPAGEVAGYCQVSGFVYFSNCIYFKLAEYSSLVIVAYTKEMSSYYLCLVCLD